MSVVCQVVIMTSRNSSTNYILIPHLNEAFTYILQLIYLSITRIVDIYFILAARKWKTWWSDLSE